MAAEILHDGIAWTIRPPPWRALVPLALGLGGMALPLLLAAGLGVPWLALLSLLPLGLIALDALQLPRRTRIHVGERALVIEVRRVGGQRRWALPLDGLTTARVSAPRAQGGSGSAIFRAGEVVVSVGEDQPQEHLHWLLAAVEEAQQRLERRCALEGREYSFMKHAPPEVQALRRGEPARSDR